MLYAELFAIPGLHQEHVGSFGIFSKVKVFLANAISKLHRQANVRGARKAGWEVRSGRRARHPAPRARPRPQFFAPGATQKRLLGQSEAPYTAPERGPAMQINSEEAAAGQRCPSLLFGSREIAFMSLMEK